MSLLKALPAPLLPPPWPLWEGTQYGRSTKSSNSHQTRGFRDMRSKPHPVGLPYRLTSAHLALTRGRE